MANFAVSPTLAFESFLYCSSMMVDEGFDARGSNKLVNAECLISKPLVLELLI